MLLTQLITHFFFAIGASASVGISFSVTPNGHSQQPLNALDDEDLRVPGKNPLTYCDDPKDYILDIDHVDLDPNPPQAGQPLAIVAIGDVKERIEKGAYVLLQVKYGVITLIKQTIDLCEQLGNVDMECPIDEGTLTLGKNVDIPREIPPGKYTVSAKAYTKDDKEITCLNTEVHFSR